MLTAELYHQFVKTRRSLPCRPTRLYGDLLPLIFVDTNTAREVSLDTKARCNTLKKQMEKTVRTYYLRKQQVIGHLEAQRRELYKQALSLHKAMEAAKQQRNSLSTSTIESGNVTGDESVAETVSTPPVRTSQPVIEAMNSQLSMGSRKVSSTMLSDSELLPELQSTTSPGLEMKGNLSESVDNENENDQQTSRKVSTRTAYKLKQQTDAGEEDGETNNEDVFAPNPILSNNPTTATTTTRGHRWLRMPHVGEDRTALETIVESQLPDDVRMSPEADLEHELSSDRLQVTITKTVRIHQVAFAEEAQGVPPSLSQQSLPKGHLINGRKKLPPLFAVGLLPPINGTHIGEKASVQTDDASSNGLANNGAKRDSTSNLLPNNHYKMSLVSNTSTGEQFSSVKKSRSIRVLPLVPGKTRYVDWQLQPDGNYKSRIVTYEEPAFRFPNEAQATSGPNSKNKKHDKTLQISGKKTRHLPARQPHNRLTPLASSLSKFESGFTDEDDSSNAGDDVFLNSRVQHKIS